MFFNKEFPITLFLFRVFAGVAFLNLIDAAIGFVMPLWVAMLLLILFTLFATKALTQIYWQIDVGIRLFFDKIFGK